MSAMWRVLSCGAVAVLVAGATWGQAWGQMTLTPRVIQLDTLTCREFMALSQDERTRLLVYFNGYLDGMRQATTWDARLAGERIDRAVAACKSTPETPALRAFADAWSR